VLTAAQAQSEAALAELAQAEEGPRLAEALTRAVAARAEFCRLATAAAAPSAAAAQARWLHNNERASPILTALIRPPSSSSLIPALSSPAGSLLTSHSAIAERLVTHYATISSQPPVDPAAQARVLSALRRDVASGRTARIPAADAAAAGAMVISEDEVKAALHSARPAAAAGPDGIPNSLWQVGDDAWAPLLARLFTAMGTLGRCPAGFTLGTVSPILKPGAPDVTAPAAYRPITLLPTHYRLLAKVLAVRFGAAMVDAIDQEQNAFLPGRHIEGLLNVAAPRGHGA
jgi:hypothetical protein